MALNFMQQEVSKKVFLKKVSVCFVCTLMLLTSVLRGQTYQFETFNGGNTPAFTVSHFQTVTIDKRGKVWAGSTLGGLYCYREGVWVKINTYPDITFRHAVPSNMPGDSNVWITSIGKSGAQAVSGGAFHINTDTETVTQYGLAGGLSTNFVNSLAYSSTGQIFVALQQSISGTTIRQGGVFKASTVNPIPPPSSAFIRAIPGSGDVSYHSAGNRGDELWFGRGVNCASGCIAPYIARVSASGFELPPIKADTINNLPFTTGGASAFARAIFTDSSQGNTFIGLNSGGLAVYKSNGKWHRITSDNSPFPLGAAVYFNAIAEVYGQVWIGTSAGIFVYNGRGPLEDFSSYKLLTTANGLPNNFVTDIAVDTARKQIWITTSTGISRCDYIPPFISGFVFDGGIVLSSPTTTKAPLLSSNFVKDEPNGMLVSLYEGSTFIEGVVPEPTGYFEFIKAQDGKNYRVEYEYVISPRLKHEVLNVKNHTMLPEVIFPIRMVRETKQFKPFMKERVFNLPISYVFKPGHRWEGFDVSNYDKSYQNIEAGNTLQLKLDRMTHNLANFYSSSATAYTLGGYSTDLVQKSIGYALELTEAMLEFVTMSFKTKKTHDDLLNDQLATQFERLVDNIVIVLKRVGDTSPEAAEALKPVLGIIEESKFLFSYIKAENGDAGDKFSFVKDQLKKAIAYIGAGVYYKVTYCGTRHKSLITNSANSSYNGASSKKYPEVYSEHYNTMIAPSEKMLNTSSTEMDKLGDLAGYAKYTAEMAEISSRIVLVTPGAWLAPWLKLAAVAANSLRVGFLTGAMIEGYASAVEIAKLSDNTLSIAQLGTDDVKYIIQNQNAPVANISLTALMAARQGHDQKLTDLKNYFNLNVYDSVSYFPKLKAVSKADSAFSKELKGVLESINAAMDSARISHPSISTMYNGVLELSVIKRNFLQEGFFFNNLAYIYDSVKTGYRDDFVRMTDSLLLLNDSALSGLQRIANSLMQNNVKTSPRLVQTNFVIHHSFNTGDPGSFTYTFSNFGGSAVPNLSFKLSAISGGYLFSGTDSFTVGNVLPGQAFNLTVPYIASQVDSTGYFDLNIFSNGLLVSTIPGALFAIDPAKHYTVKPGLWSDPTVWMNGSVPNQNSIVDINHAIEIDINADCKRLNNNFPGGLTIRAGMQLKVYQ